MGLEYGQDHGPVVGGEAFAGLLGGKPPVEPVLDQIQAGAPDSGSASPRGPWRAIRGPGRPVAHNRRPPQGTMTAYPLTDCSIEFPIPLCITVDR